MNIDKLPIPLFIAHRGIRHRFPENTIAAFQGAINAGAHMIELDVCLTKDRQIVVIHDETVDRTTNGNGKVRRLTMEELAQLDAGSWFDPKFSGEQLPTLAQVLALAKGKILVNIEIKPEAFEAHGPSDAIELQVLGLVRSHQMEENVLVSCFQWQVLQRLREKAPDIALGLLSDVPADDRLFAWCRKIQGFSWHPDYRVVTRPHIEVLHQMGAKVFPYAVNGSIDTRRMREMGVDGLMVDDPDQMTVSSI